MRRLAQILVYGGHVIVLLCFIKLELLSNISISLVSFQLRDACK